MNRQLSILIFFVSGITLLSILVWTNVWTVFVSWRVPRCPAFAVPSNKLCYKNPVLHHNVMKDIDENEKKAAKWFTELPFMVDDMLKSEYEEGKPPFQGTDLGHYPHDLGGAKTENRFDPMSVITANCSDISTIEQGIGFGGNKKLMCSPESFAKTRNLVVFSIGSNNDWGFEEAIYDRMIHAEIHTFDCFTLSIVPKRIRSRTKIHTHCIGDPSRSIDGKQFKSLEELAEIAEVDHIDILKMDVEGSEWDIFPHLLTTPLGGGPLLPYQILFELHLCEFNYRRARSTFEVAMLASMLHVAGYRMVSSDPVSPKCREFSAVRMICG